MTAASQIVYVASPESEEIHVFELDAAGSLSPLQVVVTPGQAQPLAISPDRQYLYAGVRPENGLVSYRIAVDGHLSELGCATLPGSPTYISTDGSGQLVFSASYADNVLSASPVDKNGVAGPVSQIFPNLARSHAARTDPANHFLLVPTLGNDQIQIFRLESGQLTLQGHKRTHQGAGPRHPVFHPDAPYMYCINELDGTIDVWSFNPSTGALGVRQSVNALPPDFSGKPWSADLHLTPDARFIYGCDRTASTISIHRVIDGGAKLELVGHAATETQPRGFAISACGRFLIAAGQMSHHVSVYRIDAETGALTFLQRQPAGQGPIWVQILTRD